EEVLGILHEELKKVTGKMPQYNFEFLFVNDGMKN
ncbi:glycosyltransferase, partial [Parabacteroides distasonis]